jgi:hypothetical protein
MRYETEAWINPLEELGTWQLTSHYLCRADSADWGGWEVTDEFTAFLRALPAPPEPGFSDKLAGLFGGEAAPAAARGMPVMDNPLPAQCGG